MKSSNVNFRIKELRIDKEGLKLKHENMGLIVSLDQMLNDEYSGFSEVSTVLQDTIYRKIRKELRSCWYKKDLQENVPQEVFAIFVRL